MVGRLLMETRRYLMVHVWSERVILINYSSFRMKAGRNIDRGLHGWNRWRWEWIFPLAPKRNTVTGESLGIGRESHMIDWAVAKYQFVRALNWSNSRKNCWKKMKGRESGRNRWNMQIQADGPITNLSAWDCSQDPRLGADELFLTYSCRKGVMQRGGFHSLNWSERTLFMREVFSYGLLALELINRNIQKKVCLFRLSFSILWPWTNYLL